MLYQPTLTRIEDYLQQMVEETRPVYAEAYRPWLESLQNLMQGVYLVARKIPLPDTDSLKEALRMFSFDGAIEFLRDICRCCKHMIPENWAERFREHINMLLFSLSILSRQQQQQPSLSR